MDVVRHLLESQGHEGLNLTVKKKIKLVSAFPMSPLEASMWGGSFAVARVLLEAKANPGLRRPDALRQDAFFTACYASRSDNVKSWLDFFGGTWNMEPDGFGFNA